MKQEKSKKETELIQKIDRAINELVYEKVQIIKAYNYYHAKRDPEQFRHLEENYGIGTPTSVEFTPLAKNHIDVLLGEYISTPVQPKVSCKDEETISSINRQKQLHINNSVAKKLRSHLRNLTYAAISGDPKKASDPLVEKELGEVIKSAERNFISDWEMAGQNIVDYSMISKDIDFANKRKTILSDLLIAGMCYYRVGPTSGKTNVDLQVLNPINTFIDRNPISPYLKNSGRAVVRHYMTKDQILAKYGEYLSEDDLDELDSLEDYGHDSAATYLRSSDAIVNNPMTDGILGGFEITPIMPFEQTTSQRFKTYPVYEVEYLQTDRENGEFIVNRYEGVRINTNIYITFGKSDKVVRSIDSPRECTLSVNGIFHLDRNGEPFSLIIKTAHLQDKYDCLHFYRDNIIAESGSVGDWVDIAHLPKFLGQDVTERILKFKAYKKQGLALFDSSQEGEQMNTTFNGFDDTIKLEAIQAIDLAIERVELTCSKITGVFREKLGGIEQRDAVTNVEVGVTQSSYITKPYYQLMDLMTREILVDILNTSKIVYKNGISGTIVLGERLNKIFTALPEHYSFTDFDIHISDSSETKRELEVIKQLTIELSKGGQVDPELIIQVATATGLTKMKNDVLESISRNRQENDQVGQLSQQVEQLDKQLKEAQSQATKLENEVKRLNEVKLRLEEEKFEFEKELGWFTAKNEDDYNDSKLELDKKRVELEAVQLLDDNKNNDEIKNS